MARRFIAWILLAGCVGCAVPSQHVAEDIRLYRGRQDARPVARDSLVCISYNIKFGQDVAKALDDLQALPLQPPWDVVLLQEMDAEGAAWLAERLAMNHVYRPSYVHPRTGRLFGNAILSPWPLENPRVLTLEHPNPLTGDHRTVLAADVRVGNGRLRAVSAHLATWLVAHENRLEQAVEVRDSLLAAPGAVLLGGDFNTGTEHEVKLFRRIFRAAGLEETRLQAQSTVDAGLLGRLGLDLLLDHLYQRGLVSVRAGVGGQASGSDHRPIWGVYRWP